MKLEETQTIKINPGQVQSKRHHNSGLEVMLQSDSDTNIRVLMHMHKDQ